MGFENWEGVVRHPVIGALWETHVVMQVVKHFFSLGGRLFRFGFVELVIK